MLTEQAKMILSKRYYQKGENWSKLCRRVAKAVASVEKEKKEEWENKFYDIMHNLDFLPNTPTLVNAGVTNNSLSACYVVDIEDSLDGIVDTARLVGKIQKFGGGTGCCYDKIRPTCMDVKTTGRPACGVVGAMKVVNTSSSVFEQGCKRNGANMAILSVWHPDIVHFIKSKRMEGVLSNVNISVNITNDFIGKNSEEIHEVHFGSLKGYLEPDGTFTKHKNRKVLTIGEITDMIVDGMHANGEPGIVFMDRINEAHTIENKTICSTNPCGEQPLLPYESCNLGSINLYNMINGTEIDADKLQEVVTIAVRFLDNVIDVNEMPDDLKVIEETTKKYRKIGLGVMGFADMLYAIGIKYGTAESVELGRYIMRQIGEMARAESEQIANEKGSFPEIKRSKFVGVKKMRNATVTTIAPTGSISMIAGVSSGIEPVFKKVMKVKTGGIGDYVVEDRAYVEYKDKYNKEIFVEAADVRMSEHIDMQAAFQEFTDNAVSKTINAPNKTGKNEIRDALMSIFTIHTNIKGITFYRDGSRSVQAIDSVDSNGKVIRTARDSKEEGVTYKRSVACGTMYVVVNHDSENNINEVFATLGKGGSCNYSFLESLGKVISVGLQCGVPIETIIKQLRGIRCSNVTPTIKKGGAYLSCSDAIARTLIESYEELTKKEIKVEDKGHVVQTCPDCNSPVVFEQGCKRCIYCGWGYC